MITKRILAAIIGITTVFTCVSCLNRMPADPEKADLSVLPAQGESKVINLCELQTEKRTSVTIEEVRELIAESERLYSEYDEIVLGSDDGEKTVIRTDAGAAAAGDNVTAGKYRQYLSDVQAIFLYRLGQTLAPGNCVSEWDLGADYVLAKNSPIMMTIVYMDIDNSEGSPFADTKYKFDYFMNETREYDMLSYSTVSGPDGTTSVISVFYKQKGTGHSAEEIFPSAEQKSALNAIIAREAAANPGNQ